MMRETIYGRMVLLTDAPPLREMAGGCHGLATHILDAGGANIPLCVTHRLSRSIKPPEIRQWWGERVLLLPDSASWGLKRFSQEFSRIVDLGLALPGLWFAKKRVRASGAERILVLMGGDGWYLPIVRMASAILGLPYDLYLVDDLEDSAFLWRRKLLLKILRPLEAGTLRGATRVWAISPGFAAHIAEKYQVPVRWLPPPMVLPAFMHRPYHRSTPDLRNILFIGGLSELYLDPLVDLYHLIERWNQSGKDYELRLHIVTYGSTERLLSRLPHQKYIVTETRLPVDEVENRLTSCWATFLPYSFAPKMRKMVETSFSWKLQDSFKSGRPILVYGPLYGSISRYFEEAGLPLRAGSKEELWQALSLLEQKDGPELIQSYADVWEKHHSPRAFQSHWQGAGKVF